MVKMEDGIATMGIGWPKKATVSVSEVPATISAIPVPRPEAYAIFSFTERVVRFGHT